MLIGSSAIVRRGYFRCIRSGLPWSKCPFEITDGRHGGASVRPWRRRSQLRTRRDVVRSPARDDAIGHPASTQIQEIIGFGPFTVSREEWRSGDRMMFRRNPS